MSGLSIRPYDPAEAEAWNRFVATSRSGTFLHDRGLMDYHADRFTDCSLVVEDAGRIVALLPANRDGDRVVSHGGLTYGGLLTGASMQAGQMVEIMAALAEWLRAEGVAQLSYKPVPHIFHAQPAEDDIYALTQVGAMPVRCDLASAIPMARRLPLAKGRKSGASKARREGVSVAEAEDFTPFWTVLAETLGARHDAAPVHTLDEIRLLKARFPDRIRLFVGQREGRVLAGVVMFDCGRVAHAQYMAAAPEGRDLGALDLVVKHLLDDVFARHDWFDFGISTTDGGRELNVGLSRQKEMFGARSVVFQHYALDLT